VAPFSITHTDSSGLSCLSRIANDSPAGPAPTVTTSYSMTSRSTSLMPGSVYCRCAILGVCMERGKSAASVDAADAAGIAGCRCLRGPGVAAARRGERVVRRPVRGYRLGKAPHPAVRTAGGFAAPELLDRGSGSELHVFGNSVRTTTVAAGAPADSRAP